MNVHILDDWFDTLRSLPCFDALQSHDVTVWTDHEEDIDTLAARLADAEALVLFRERTAITAPLLARLPRLKLISQRSVYPHIDVPACTDHGVMLCSNQHAGTPSYAAAELTLALMLGSYRQIPAQTASLKARGIITPEDLAQMQPRALLINTSRSGLIETGALEAEIERGRIHAAVDVFDVEPLTDTAHPLLTHPNVLATPHIGYVTEDEFELQFTDIFEQVNAFADGKPIHVINPEVAPGG